MVKSMTGYGKAEAAVNNKKITVEIRSLNSKQLDLSIKLPAIYRQQEYEIRNSVAKTMQRGKVDVFITVETAATVTGSRINKELFADYYRQLQEASKLTGIQWESDAVQAELIPSLLRLPDVVNNEADAIPEEEIKTLLTTVSTALQRIDEFRIQEGATLIADLLHRVDKILQYKEEVIPYEKARTETIKNRIRESIETVGIPVDTNRLEQEMIFYIEKLDITEEKVRLTNHCKYFHEVAALEEGVGRKLGFIAQEMGREINTLGSKANEATIQRLVVAMKDELEKIKEQVLNIL